jgi:hypothetical protein
MERRYLIFIFCLLGLFSCSKLGSLVTFPINEETSVQISSSTIVNVPFDLPSANMTTNSSQEFENNNTEKDLVKDVKLENLKLTVTNPNDKTFSFLKSIHLFISSEGNDEIELAYLDTIPVNATSILLIPTEAKLDPYIKASTYKLRTRVETREILSQTTDIQVNAKFKVTANVF